MISVRCSDDDTQPRRTVERHLLLLMLGLLLGLGLGGCASLLLRGALVVGLILILLVLL